MKVQQQPLQQHHVSPFIIFVQILLALLFLLSQYVSYISIPTSTALKFGVHQNFANNIINHTRSLIDIGNSNANYESSRALAREYIRDTLLQHNFTMDQILWNKFEYIDKKSRNREIITTTWTGINILVWTNSTPCTNTNHKIRIFGAHYDTLQWGNGKTTGAYDNLSGTGMLIELAIAVKRYQQERIAQEGNDTQVPFLFIFFDHNKSGSLGSKTFVKHNDIGKNANDIAFYIHIDSIGKKGSIPFLQTYPYEHAGKTKFSPLWLTRFFIQSTLSLQVPKHPMSVYNIGIGNSLSTLHSLRYQLSRYHLISVRYMNDDGPFAWQDIPSLLFTDNYNFVFQSEVRYNVTTDLPEMLDNQLLQKEASILVQCALLAQQPEINNMRYFSNEKSVAFDLYNSIQQFTKRLFYHSHDQYLVLGSAFYFNFVDCMCISIILLLLIYSTTFKDVRHITRLISTVPNAPYISTHRVLFIHLALLCVALSMDTIYATAMIVIGAMGMLLIPVTTGFVGIIASFITGAICTNITMFDVFVMRMYGERTAPKREARLLFMIFIYSMHCILLFLYALDYYLKETRFIAHMSSQQQQSQHAKAKVE